MGISICQKKKIIMSVASSFPLIPSATATDGRFSPETPSIPMDPPLNASSDKNISIMYSV